MKFIKKDGGNINNGNTVSLISSFSTLSSLIKTNNCNYKENKIFPSSFNEAIITKGSVLTRSKAPSPLYRNMPPFPLFILRKKKKSNILLICSLCIL